MLRTTALALIVSCFALRAAAADCETCGTPDGFEEAHGFADGYMDGEEDMAEPFRTQGGGWTFTSGGVANPFAPTVLTWSIAPNFTALPQGLGEPVGSSNLISFLDGIHHGGASPGGTDLTQRAWFSLFNSSFERWDQLSGLTINYEPKDDGVTVAPGNIGSLNRRGDIRIGGHHIDGQISPTYLAYSYFPNNSDMIIDTDEINRWGNPEGNYLRFRNMLTHEFGHGLGLNHVSSGSAQFLMEPFLATDFDGPQLDDILGIQRLYGDVNESGTGNDSFFTATTLGTLSPGDSIAIGTDAVDTAVAFDEVDFVSIDSINDVDYFKISIPVPTIVKVVLTPLGPTYLEGPQGGLEEPFNTSRMSDLALTLYQSDGVTPIDFENDGGLGQSETINGAHLLAAGNYYVSVVGTENLAQFYELQLSAVPEPATISLMACYACVLAIRRRR